MRTLAERQTIQAAKAIQARERKERKASKPAQVVKMGQQPRVRDNEHLKRIRRLPCLATLIRTGEEAFRVDACHVRANYSSPGWGGNPGLACKPSDWRTLPLKRSQHMLQHSMNEIQYWNELHVHPPTVCAALRDAESFEAMLNVIRNAARIARETR